MEPLAGAVLDSSALLAYLQYEPGREVVSERLFEGAFMSVVNYAEVLSRLADAGDAPAASQQRLIDAGLVGGLIELVPFTQDDAIAAAELRPPTRPQGLSLGDRSCLATALRLRRPVLTADRSWAAVQAGITVSLIR